MCVEYSTDFDGVSTYSIPIIQLSYLKNLDYIKRTPLGNAVVSA